MLETFTCATFGPRLGEAFRLHVDGESTVEVRLVEATELPGAAGATRAPFSIVFREGSDAVLPQRIYRIQHADLGTFDLFLVPIGPDAEGMLYEAVFA